MNVILLGPPGAGKGTQGKILADRLGVPKVATGDLLRAAVTNGTPLGRQAQDYMDQGLLVPDEIIMGLIEEVLKAPEAEQGIVMDGFPRTTVQAEAVDMLLRDRGGRVDRVLNFVVPDDELVNRLRGRAADEGRTDDTPETIRKRLAVYREQTEPLVVYYRDRGLLTEVEAAGTIEDIAERVQEAIGQ